MATSAVVLPTAGTMPLPHTAATGIYRTPYRTYGLHKTAATILANQGDCVTVINDKPYFTRHESAPLPGGRVKGARPMHRTTLTLAHQKHNSYGTTHNKFHGGKLNVEPCERPVQYPSQHFTQFALVHRDASGSLLAANPALNYSTNYKNEYPTRDVDRPARLHFPTYQNKMNMNEGSGIKGVMKTTNHNQARYQYWSHYNRTHNKLGVMLGPGVPRERQIRLDYNPITGEEKGPGWKENNRSISSNRTLYHHYDRKPSSSFMY